MKRVENRSVPITINSCDKCGKDSAAGTGGVGKCHICKIDVCYKCSVLTDMDYLTPGSFIGDHPYHFCKNCWEKGEEVRKAIFACRIVAEKEEDHLWDRWREGCAR